MLRHICWEGEARHLMSRIKIGTVRQRIAIAPDCNGGTALQLTGVSLCQVTLR